MPSDDAQTSLKTAILALDSRRAAARRRGSPFPLACRLRGARRSGRPGDPGAADHAQNRHRRDPPEGHDLLAGNAGVLRPGTDQPPALRLDRSYAVVSPGAPDRPRLRDVLDGPGPGRAGARASRSDGRRDRKGEGPRAEGDAEGAALHRAARPADRGAGRPALRREREARGLQSGARRGARGLPRGRRALDPARQRRRGGIVGPRAVRRRRLDRLLRSRARALARAPRRAPLPRPLLREHRPARGRRRARKDLRGREPRCRPRAAHVRTRPAPARAMG